MSTTVPNRSGKPFPVQTNKAKNMVTEMAESSAEDESEADAIVTAVSEF